MTGAGKSSDGFQIRPHHVGDAADLRRLQQIVHRRPSIPPALTQRLQGHVQTGFVAVLEAVGNGLGEGVDPDRDAVDAMFLDAEREGAAGKPDDPQRGVLHFRPAGLDVDRQPDFVRGLRGHLVELEGREEADDAVRHALAGLGQRLVLTRIGVGQHVQAPTGPIQDAAAVEADQVFAWNPGSTQFQSLIMCHPDFLGKHTNSARFSRFLVGKLSASQVGLSDRISAHSIQFAVLMTKALT